MKTKRAVPKTAKPYKAKPGHVLILRTSNADRTSHGGFKWPAKGPVSCDDWSPEPSCGNGLHGFLKGEGDGSLANWADDATWQVISVREDTIVKIDSAKVKFPRGIVVHSGSKAVALAMILAAYPGHAVIGATITAGYKGTATAGYKGTATAGNKGTATAGYKGTATAGHYGQATAGYKGKATAGYYGQATAGDSGTATAGDSGTATAGDSGTATAGDSGTLVIKHWDGSRYRLIVAYVGENGIEANTAYKIVDSKLVKVTS